MRVTCTITDKTHAFLVTLLKEEQQRLGQEELTLAQFATQMLILGLKAKRDKRLLVIEDNAKKTKTRVFTTQEETLGYLRSNNMADKNILVPLPDGTWTFEPI